MTSSLVGSEMCIRDRPSTSFHPNRNGRQCVTRPKKGASIHEPPHLAVSVSYTHLTLPTICSV
eukprot:7458981-Prorocentrum_lima.AAC.1